MIAKDIVEKMEILATQSIYDNLTTLFELYEIISVREFSFYELMKDVRKIKEFEYNEIALYRRFDVDELEWCYEKLELPKDKPDLGEVFTTVGLFTVPIYLNFNDKRFGGFHWNGRRWLKEGEV